MNTYVNQIEPEDKDWENTANGKASFSPVSSASFYKFSSIFLNLDDAFIGDEHKVAVSTYLWEEESPDAWYDQQYEDSYFHIFYVIHFQTFIPDAGYDQQFEDWGVKVHFHTLRYEESEKLPRTYLALFKVYIRTIYNISVSSIMVLKANLA